MLPYTSGFAVATAYCIRSYFSPDSFILGMNRKILPDNTSLSHSLLVLLVLLQTYMRSKNLALDSFIHFPESSLFTESVSFLVLLQKCNKGDLDFWYMCIACCMKLRMPYSFNFFLFACLLHQKQSPNLLMMLMYHTYIQLNCLQGWVSLWEQKT